MKTICCFLAAISISGAAQDADIKEIKALTRQVQKLDRGTLKRKPAKKDDHEVEVGEARVEQVLKTDFDGYINMHYLATWKGRKIVIDDPIHATDFEVGDKVYFLVMKHDMTSRGDEKPTRLISFMVR